MSNTDRISLLMIDGPQQGVRVLLPVSGPATIGRNPRCEIVIDHPLVSRRHCMVTTAAGNMGVEIVDLMSNNGTKINGQKISAATFVGAGKRFRVGPTEFEVQPFNRSAGGSAAGSASSDERDDVLELLGIDPDDDDGSDSVPTEDWRETQSLNRADLHLPALRIDLDRQKTLPLKVAGEVRNFAATNGFADDALLEIGIATASIVENTLKHAGRGGLQVRCDDKALQIEVWDNGPGVPDDLIDAPPPGGGMERAKASMDQFRVTSSPGNTRVLMHKSR